MKRSRSPAAIRKAFSVAPDAHQLSVAVTLDVRAELREMMVAGGLAIMQALFNEEVTALCGARYARKSVDQSVRYGEQGGEVVLGGRRMRVIRPRVRKGGHEVTLSSYAHLQDEDALDERAMEQMVIGVSTRKYGRSLEHLPTDAFGASKSSVSRRFVQMSQEALEARLAEPLGDRRWPVLMIDGIHFAEHVVLVVVGIDARGEKRVLGLREGTTENAEVCRSLLRDLVGRGLDAAAPVLVVVDGGKGLAKAVREVFGSALRLQRCQIHKMRNVLGHLPDKEHARVRSALRSAWREPDFAKAKSRLETLARSLSQTHPSAAESIREGLEETLTVKALGLSGWAGEVVRDDEHHRERLRSNAARRWPCEALGQRRDGLALGRHRRAGS